MGIFTDSGYQKESLAEWKIKVEDLFKEEFGDDVDLDPSGPFGQLVAPVAKIMTDQDEITEEVYLSRDPDSATGISLDHICAETGTKRDDAGFTFIQDVLCYGDEGTPLAADENRITLDPSFSPADDLYFALVDSIVITKTIARKAIFTPDVPVEDDEYTITIDSIVYSVIADADPTIDEVITAMIAELPSKVTGTLVDGTLEIFATADFSFDYNSLWTLSALASAGNFQSNTSGVITAPANSLIVIVTPISGWDSVNNPSAGETGTVIEKDPALRIRRRNELISGKSTDNAIRIAVEKVEDVSTVAVFSNRTLAPDASGIPAKAFETVALGGEEDEIAQAIYENMPAGIEPYGTNDSGTAIDPNDGTEETIPFSRPVPLYVWVRVTRIPNTEESYPSDGDEQVKAAIVEWAETYLKQGTDVIRLRIATPVYSVPGSGDLTIEIDSTATPGGTPTYAEDDIIVLNRESAEITVGRITMIEGPKMAELEVLDYPQISLSLLIERFKDSEDFQKIGEIAAEAAMDLQTTIFEIREKFILSTATGPELTIIGNVWDISRKLDVVETDDEYRVKIEAKAVLTISGTISEIKQILLIFYGASYVTYETDYPAGFKIITDGTMSQHTLNRFTVAGVQGVFHVRASGSSNAVSSVAGNSGVRGSSNAVSSVSGNARRIVRAAGSSNAISSVSGDAIVVSPPIPADLIAFSISTTVTGWDKMDGIEESPSLIGKYPKVHASEGSSAGSETHNHAAFSGSTGTNETISNGTFGSDLAIPHTHTINHTHPSNENNEPEYLEVLPVSNGGEAELLTTMFLFYNGSSAPSGWSPYATAYDKLFKGANTPGGTGGNSTHSHSFTGNTGNTSPGSVRNTTGSASCYSTALGNHLHSLTHAHSNGNNYPLWHGLLPVIPDSDTMIIPSGICAFFKGSVIPYGWSAFSAATGKWIQGKSTNGATGGANTHNHVLAEDGLYYNNPIRLSSCSNPSANLTGKGDVGLGHKHTVNHTHDTVNNEPPYQELMFLKKD